MGFIQKTAHITPILGRQLGSRNSENREIADEASNESYWFFRG
jgi:hypothetical protein